VIGRSRVAAAEGDRRVAFEHLASDSLDGACRIAGVILGQPVP
jgi:hypothetical protein